MFCVAGVSEASIGRPAGRWKASCEVEQILLDSSGIYQWTRSQFVRHLVPHFVPYFVPSPIQKRHSQTDILKFLFLFSKERKPENWHVFWHSRESHRTKECK